MLENFSVDIEGGDQVGKGDAVGNIAKKLAREGYEVCVVSFPCYATPVGNGVRKILKEDFFNSMGLDLKEALSSKMALFALNRLEVLNFLIQQKGQNIYVFDRGPFSSALSIAYACVKGLPDDNREGIVEEALNLDLYFRQKMLVDKCVIRLFNETNNWSKEREDVDLHESKDVQYISEEIYKIFRQKIGPDWIDIPSRGSNDWRLREDICDDCIGFIRKRLRLAPSINSKRPKYLSVGDMLANLYKGSEIDPESLDGFVSSVKCNDKGKMYKYSEEIVDEVVSSMGDIKWYNEEIKRIVRILVTQNPAILVLLGNLYGEIFVSKFVKSFEDGEKGVGQLLA